jgi:hypothetical protein
LTVSLHISSKGLADALNIAQSGNESLTTIIHKKISKAIKYHTGNNTPLFFFTLAYEEPKIKKAKGADVQCVEESQCYSGLHIHGMIALTENEIKSRKIEGRDLRFAFKRINSKTEKNKSFSNQEFYIPTPSKLAFYKELYSENPKNVNNLNQCQYMAKNTLQFERWNVGNNIIKLHQKPYSASKQITGLARRSKTPPEAQNKQNEDCIAKNTNVESTPIKTQNLHSEHTQRMIDAFNKELKENPEFGLPRRYD